MPGVLYKKKSGGEQFPDWTKIGYAQCPDTTVDGWIEAYSIKQSWDPTKTSYAYEYENRYDLMYFPRNVDTSGITTIKGAFKHSNLEDIDINVSGVTGDGLVEAFRNCKNLRRAFIGNDPTSGCTSYANMFQDCYALKYMDIDLDLPGDNNKVSSIDHLCSGCYSLTGSFLIAQSYDSGTKLEYCGNAFRDCYNIQELTIASYHIKELQGNQYIGKDTADGCLMKITAGALANSDLIAEFQGCKIKGGSEFTLSRMRPSAANEMFKNAEFMAGSTDITIDPTMNNSLNAYNYFRNTKIHDNMNISGIHLGLKDIGNSQGMFSAITMDTGKQTIDLSDCSWRNCANFEGMFAGSNVVTIEGLSHIDMSSATNMTNMFQNGLMDNDTINAILLLVTGATSYTGTKTLAQLGFTAANYPAATIQSLSNYSAFTAAGWTIGY